MPINKVIDWEILQVPEIKYKPIISTYYSFKNKPCIGK